MPGREVRARGLPGYEREHARPRGRLRSRRRGRQRRVLPGAPRRARHRGGALGGGLRRVGQVREDSSRSTGATARRSARWRGRASPFTPTWPGSSGPTTATGAWRRSCWPRASGAAASADHRVPAPAWLDGDGTVLDALGSVETTAQVDPARFTAALVGAAEARGATLGWASWRACSVARARPAGSPSMVTPSRPTPSSWPWAPGRGAPSDLAAPAGPWPQGLQRDAGRARGAGARAVRRLPHGGRPPARAGDLSPARRGGLRVRHGGPGAAAGLAGRGRRQRGRVRRPRARRRPRVEPARRGPDHRAPGLLPARDGRRPAADRRRCRAWRAPSSRPATAPGACSTRRRPAGPSPS